MSDPFGPGLGCRVPLRDLQPSARFRGIVVHPKIVRGDPRIIDVPPGGVERADLLRLHRRERKATSRGLIDPRVVPAGAVPSREVQGQTVERQERGLVMIARVHSVHGHGFRPELRRQDARGTGRRAHRQRQCQDHNGVLTSGMHVPFLPHSTDIRLDTRNTTRRIWSVLSPRAIVMSRSNVRIVLPRPHGKKVAGRNRRMSLRGGCKPTKQSQPWA